jgi:hypothetical protein
MNTKMVTSFPICLGSQRLLPCRRGCRQPPCNSAKTSKIGPTTSRSGQTSRSSTCTSRTTTVTAAEDIVPGRRGSPDAPHDERSTYTYSYSSVGGNARGDIESYYFGAQDAASDYGADDSTEAQSRASFVDDERSHGMRSRLIARVDALYGAEKLPPPVPKLQPF